jgi:putative Ig domain-containing protein
LEISRVPLSSSLSQPVFLAILGMGSAGHPGAESNAPALQIAGKASDSAAPSVFYAFTPTVTQRANKSLKFSIENKPAWASFGARRGTLYGTPLVASAGTYSNIRITVSDGTRSVTLPAFSITVTAPAADAK